MAHPVCIHCVGACENVFLLCSPLSIHSLFRVVSLSLLSPLSALSLSHSVIFYGSVMLLWLACSNGIWEHLLDFCQTF